MEQTSKSIYKWFWAWEDHKEEAWLEQKAMEGWLLDSFGFPGVYLFRKSEPGRWVYRLDFQTALAKELGNYQQIFGDAGWSLVGTMGGWYYWRKPAAPEEQAEIFSDNQGKIEKYRRLIGYLFIFYPIMIISLTSLPERGGVLIEVITFLFFAFIVLFCVGQVMLWRRTQQLKKG